MKHPSLLLCTLLIFALAACGTAPTTETPTESTSQTGVAAPEPTRPPAPTSAPTEAPTSAPTAIPLAAFTAELSATVVASLPPTATPKPGENNIEPGIDGANALALQAPSELGPLWAAWSHGMRAFDPSQNHFVAVYTHGTRGWQKLDQIELPNDDYLDPAGVAQVQVDSKNVWLEAQGGAGAHGGCYDLLRFDGQKLHSEVSSCGVSPGLGWLTDVNDDGTPDVVIDTSDAYVFCYACGVRKVDYQVLRWDGQHMVEMQLASLPETAPADLRTLNDQALAQARAGFWKGALATAAQIAALNAHDATADWNAGLIKLIGEGRAEQASSGAYPLLDNLFFGDYAAALEPMRQLAPDRLFAADTPLVKGTTAEGWEQPLADYITQTVELALAPEASAPPATQAAAHFLRGWALHLADPASPAALAEIEQAAKLAPDDKLFIQSRTYLLK